MKPILLTMQAFGSYGEKTEIDFQKGGDFFLISGDTGSGKSTIFDAMMFALYGEVSTNGSGKENELLSQFVDVRNDKPLVSLVFTAHQHGQEETYKITRTPRHIRPAKRTGAKQQEEGETAELLMPDGSQYPGKLSDTNRKIEELVGLTADQFRKVVMIAQGEFMDFLRADSKAKTALLRDLLKTDYYYQLSERLKTLAKEKNTAAKTQRANMSFFAGRAVTEGLPEEDALTLDEAKGTVITAKELQPEQVDALADVLSGVCARLQLHDEAGAPCVDAPDFTAMTQVDIYTRRTPDYILSCAQDFRKGRMGYQQHPWTASLGGKAVIFTTNPASTEYSNRPNCWAGNLTLPRAVQHENVLLCLYRVEPDFVDYLYSHLYFPRHEMDEVVEKEGWIFGRKGDGYAAVYSLLPGYWEKKDPAMFKELYAESWQEKYDRADDYEYLAQGHANVWVIEMGSKAENGSFEAFMDGFAGKKVCGDTHNLIYQSPSQGEITFGWNRPLTVGGETICIHGYKRYDNEFAQTEFDAGAIEINAGGHQTILDFEKAERTDI